MDARAYYLPQPQLDARMVTVVTAVVGAGVGVLAWLGANVVGKPILEVREKRREALRLAERYCGVDHRSSDSLRQTALSALVDISTTLRAYSRESSIGSWVWCKLWDYDLEAAADLLSGLAEHARGEYSISMEVARNNRDGIYISLNAFGHLSSDRIAELRSMIAQVRASPDNQTLES